MRISDWSSDVCSSDLTPVFVVANKTEGRAAEPGVLETYALGFGEPVPISAEHGQGMADLFQALLPHLEREEENAPAAEDDEELADAVLKIAIVGRPNAGKSTLINRILGEDRLITGPDAGITRESIGIDWDTH